jgi:hypothetical protein
MSLSPEMPAETDFVSAITPKSPTITRHHDSSTRPNCPVHHQRILLVLQLPPQTDPVESRELATISALKLGNSPGYSPPLVLFASLYTLLFAERTTSAPRSGQLR